MSTTADSERPQAVSGSQAMTGGDAVINGLHRWGVDTVFGVPGVQLDDLFDAFHRNGGGIRLVHTRHEQGAAYMALGYAMATGRPGVFTVVPGPGVLNAGAALSTAYAVGAPVLCVTSTVALAQIGRGNGALHDIPDQSGFLRGLTKWHGRAAHPAQVPELLDEAFRQLLTGRPRPVALEVPPDVLAQLAAVRVPSRRPDILTFPVDPAKIARMVELLGDARNPMIVVGGGALRAGAPLRTVAELLQAPVVSRQLGRGALSDHHALSLPAAAALPLWKDVDVVLGVGTRLQQLLDWGHDANLRVLRIDLDPEEMVRVAPPDVALLAEAGEGLAALASALAARNLQRRDRTAECRAVKEAFRREIAVTMQPQVGYLDVIREELPEDGVFVDEMTQVGYVSKFGLPIYHPRTFIDPGYQGTLGFGFATALGVQAADPTRPVVSVNGDGGFMYTMPELATAVLHGLPLVAIVFSDGNFGNVKRVQALKFDGRTIACRLHNPDFAALANLFGAKGHKADSPETLRTALREALQAREPALIEIPVDIGTMPLPWRHIHGRQVRP